MSTTGDVPLGNLRGPPALVRLAAFGARRLPRGRFRFINWLSRNYPARFLARLPAELGGAAFECNLADSTAREVYFTGRYEHQETAIFQALLRPGNVFIDVGANWGYFSLIGAHLVGPSGRVLSLEPDPRLVAMLSRNLERNGLRQVTLLPIAATDLTGALALTGYDEHDGNFGLSRLGPGAAGASTFEVSTRPLDEVLDEFGVPVVDLLKMDIEGAEALALRGLRNSLAAGRIRRLLLEFHVEFLALFNANARDVLEPLLELGYRAWTWDGSFDAMRQAAYADHLDPITLLRPFNLAKFPPEPRFHLLWTAPGIDDPLPQ